MAEEKRRLNEKKFGLWEDLPDGKRRYWYEVEGRHGWRARYVKVIDSNEDTLRFCQEIYDNLGELVEIHEKYPIESGHVPVHWRNQP